MIRSIFPCPICGNKITHNGKFIGFGETRIISSSGKTYAARDLLLHFIEEHRYIPPEDFIEVLMEEPAITEKERIDYRLKYKKTVLIFLEPVTLTFLMPKN